jgi:hypothetical protein
MPDGSVFTNEKAVNYLKIPEGYIDSQASAVEYEVNFKGKTAVLVDIYLL